MQPSGAFWRCVWELRPEREKGRTGGTGARGAGVASQVATSSLEPQGYLPANLERRQSTLERKREEYRAFVDQYYHTRHEDARRKAFHQVGPREAAPSFLWRQALPCP